MIDSRLGRTLVNRTHHLFEMNWNVEVSHSYREPNCCTNTLVNIACSLNYNLEIYESTRVIDISHFRLTDIMEIAATQLISL